MRGVRLLRVIGFLVSILGCTTLASPAPAPTASSTPIQTSSPAPAEPTTPPSTQSSPENTVTPAPTGEPGLSTSGPYLVYFQKVNGRTRLVLLDADGIGRKTIELPRTDVLNADLISPDGHWLAFYTGSAGSYYQMPKQGEANLTLNLLDLTTGEKQVVTPILSKEYPDNFVQAAAKLNDEYKTAESLYQAFQYGITNAIAWSPDGRYLAFGGQMDGLSSDLYVYDMQTQSIQRLSSGDQELQWINWSPDGKWILHGSLFAVGAGMTYDEYAATVNGSSAPYLSNTPMETATWLNDHQYIENDAENGPGNYGLRLVDVKTGNITKLWDGAFEQYTVSPSGKWVLLMAFTMNSPNPYQEDPASFVPGWKLINLQALEKTDAPEFLADPPNAFLQAPDGELIPLIMKPYGLGGVSISGSPDSQYWIVAYDDEIKVLSADLTPLKSVPAPAAYLRNILWRPDSSGLFLVYQTEIYSMDISDGDVQLVGTGLIDDNYDLMYKWVNPQ